MKVENMISPKGNEVPNQFIIYGDNKTSFQSYKTTISTYDYENRDKLTLNKDMWDYSNTTRKYFKEFINNYTTFTYENKQQWLKEIENNDLIEVV